MPQKFTNRARSLLQSSINGAATSLSIEAGKADKYPVVNTVDWANPLDWFACLLEDAAGNYEVIKVGTRAAGSGVLGNVLRGQYGTAALSWTAGSAWVIHGPLAQDFENLLAGIFPYLTARDNADPKLEISKTGGGAAAAMFHMVAGKLTLAQSDGSGGVTADRFTFDQTNGTFTTVDIGFSSDETLKTGWRKMPRFFVQRLADVKRGIYWRKSTGRLEVGVSAQSLRELIPQAVRHDPKDGMLTVSYAQAAMVAACELAAAHGELQAEVVDLRARLARLERRT